MTSVYRLVVHCDEQASNQCQGLVEYEATDRLGLASQSDYHLVTSGWLTGFSRDGRYDVCPRCRPTVEARVKAGENPQPGANKETSDG